MSKSRAVARLKGLSKRLPDRHNRGVPVTPSASCHAEIAPHPEIVVDVLIGHGRVRFVSEKIDPAVLKALATPAGGEPPTEF